MPEIEHSENILQRLGVHVSIEDLVVDAAVDGGFAVELRKLVQSEESDPFGVPFQIDLIDTDCHGGLLSENHIVKQAYYYDAVVWAYENGITEGVSPDLFSPAVDCTRGDTVTFLYRTFR